VGIAPSLASASVARNADATSIGLAAGAAMRIKKLLLSDYDADWN
jgi:hypothetical protein